MTKVTVERRSDGLYHTMWLQRGQDDPVGFIGPCAATIILLSRILFEDEANEYNQRKRSESDAIGAAVIADMKHNPEKFLP